MEVMRLKHSYSLVIIILLFHNVALQAVDNKDNEGGENIEQEEENSIKGDKRNTTEDNVIKPIEDDERNPIEDDARNPIEDDAKNPIEDDAKNPIEDDAKNPIEDDEKNPIEGDEKNPIEKDKNNSVIEQEAISVRKPATFHWPSGMVPYTIKNKDFDAIITGRIRAAMRTIMSSSCVVFKDMSTSKPQSIKDSSPWLSIENPEGVRECSHTTLREEGALDRKAILIVGYDCMQKRDILHALLHALGFEDEVTNPQRDAYIRVVWPNIQPKYRTLFHIKKKEASQKMIEYDSMSVMHFHDRAYTVNGGATILPLIPGLLIAPSDTLSQLDVMKLRIVFGHECNKRKVANLLRTCQFALRNNKNNEVLLDDDSQEERSDGN